MTRLHGTLLALVFVSAVASLAGCGIPNDREPTDLEPAGTTTTVQP
ncbi:MAG: hypothetical protein KJS90_01010 [Acidobacteria bacterium]|nr:hypothetical protein [Acidobacteriota bacterium]